MQSEITAYRNAAYKLLGVQVAITAFGALLLYLFFTTQTAYSVLLGGLAYIIPNAWFIRSAYRSKGQPSPQTMIRRFYIGEAGKLFLTGIFFALCFWFIREINIIAMFLTFIVMIMVNVVGLAMIGIKN